jgi:hypothetical protein
MLNQYKNPEIDISKTISSKLSLWMETTPGLDTLKKVAAKSGVGFGTVQRAKIAIYGLTPRVFHTYDSHILTRTEPTMTTNQEASNFDASKIFPISIRFNMDGTLDLLRAGGDETFRIAEGEMQHLAALLSIGRPSIGPETEIVDLEP